MSASARVWGATTSSWLPASLFAVAVLGLFPASGRDDAYITLWPAHALAESGEIQNYNGERVEQSSSLLMVLALSALERLLPLEGELLARLLSFVAALLCFPFVARAERRLRGEDAVCLAPWLLAPVPCFAYWSSSGMEASLAALLSLACVVGAGRDAACGRVLSPGTAAALLLFSSVRPEGTAVLLAASLALLAVATLWGDAATRRRALALAAVTAGSGLGLAALRLAYFGSAVPQPVVAKAGAMPDTGHLRAGVEYLAASVGVALLPLTGLAAAGAVLRLREFPRVPDARRAMPLLAAGLVVAQLGFCVVTGGDWMEFGRFLAPVAPLVALLAADALGHCTRASLRRGVFALTLAAAVAGLGRASRSPESRSLSLWRGGVELEGIPEARFSWFARSNQAHLRTIPAVAFLDEVLPLLRERGWQDLRMWTYQMGFLPYQVGRAHGDLVSYVDLYGLTDRTLTGCPQLVSRLRRGRMGLLPRVPLARQATHLLAEAGACTERPPDLVLFLGPPRDEKLWAQGLVTVFEQSGLVEGHPVPLHIALRREIAMALEPPRRRQVRLRIGANAAVYEIRRRPLWSPRPETSSAAPVGELPVGERRRPRGGVRDGIHGASSGPQSAFLLPLSTARWPLPEPLP